MKAAMFTALLALAACGADGPPEPPGAAKDVAVVQR